MRGTSPLVGCVLALAAGSALVSSSAIAQTVIQPNVAQSKDTFVYSFLPSFNFNSMPGFDVIMASGRSSGGHDLRSLIQFDLTGVSLQPGQIATLNLYAADGGTVGFPVVNPTPAFPVTADVFPVTSTWDAATVNWTTQPTYGGTPIDSEIIDGINRYVTFDVTSQVSAWLANPASNFGFSVQQRDVVLNNGSVQAIYHSASGVQRPFLYVGAVPEPTGLLAIGTVGSLMLVSRKRR